MHCSDIDWSILTAIYYQFYNSVLNRRTRTTELCNDIRTLFELRNLKMHLRYIAVLTYLFVCVQSAGYQLFVIIAPKFLETSSPKLQFYHFLYGRRKQAV